MSEISFVGESIIGFVFDGRNDEILPPVGQLEFSAESGIRLYIPYIINPTFFQGGEVGKAHFDLVRSWEKAVLNGEPLQLLFEGKGKRSFTLLKFTGARSSSQGTHALLVLTVASAVLGKPKDLTREIAVQKFVSMMDGLRDFSEFQAFSFVDGKDGSPANYLSIKLLDSKSVVWECCGLDYSIKSCYSNKRTEGINFSLELAVYVETSSKKSISVFEHLAAQKRVLSLLVLLSGKTIRWRSHYIKDDSFESLPVEGSVLDATWHPILLSNTFLECSEVRVEQEGSLFPYLGLSVISASNLQKWCELLEEPDLYRAVAAATWGLVNPAKYLEPSIVNFSAVLERFGSYYTGEGRMSTACQFLTCLRKAHFDILDFIPPLEQVAAFISRVYNRLKHPERLDEYPGRLELSIANALLVLLARAQVLVLMDLDDRVIKKFVQNESHDLMRLINDNHFSFREGEDLRFLKKCPSELVRTPDSGSCADVEEENRDSLVPSAQVVPAPEGTAHEYGRFAKPGMRRLRALRRVVVDVLG